MSGYVGKYPRGGTHGPPPDDRRCPATAHQSGERCKQVAGFGTDHVGEGACKFHGGASPDYKKKLAREREERSVAEFMESRGYGTRRRDISPTRFLLDEVTRCAGNLLFIEEQLRRFDLSPDDLIRGTKSVKRVDDGAGSVATTTEVGAFVNLWVRLYFEERSAGVRAAEAAIRAGIEQRKVELAEQEGALMGALLRAAIGVLPDAYQPAAYQAARAQLALVRGGA